MLGLKLMVLLLSFQCSRVIRVAVVLNRPIFSWFLMCAQRGEKPYMDKASHNFIHMEILRQKHLQYMNHFLQNAPRIILQLKW